MLNLIGKNKISFVIFLSVFVVISGLACKLPVMNNFSQTSKIPVSTESAGDFERNIETAQQEFNQTGKLVVEITETQATSYIAMQLQQQNEQVFKNPQITFRDSKIGISGDVYQGNLRLPLNAEVIVKPNGSGGLNYEIANASIGPLPLPESLLTQLISSIEKTIGVNITNNIPNFYIEEINIDQGFRIHPIKIINLNDKILMLGEEGKDSKNIVTFYELNSNGIINYKKEFKKHESIIPVDFVVNDNNHTIICFESTTENISYFVEIDKSGQIISENKINKIEGQFIKKILFLNNNLYLLVQYLNTPELWKINHKWKIEFKCSFENYNISWDGDFEKCDDYSFIFACQDKYNNIGIFKTDLKGSILFEKSYGGSGREVAVDILPISNDNYLILGDTQSFGKEDGDIILFEIDKEGLSPELENVTIKNKKENTPVKIIKKELFSIPKKYYGLNTKIVLSAIINEYGKVDSVEVIETSGYLEIDNLAIEAVKRSIFSPAIVNNKKTKQGIQIVYNITSKENSKLKE